MIKAPGEQSDDAGIAGLAADLTPLLDVLFVPGVQQRPHFV